MAVRAPSSWGRSWALGCMLAIALSAQSTARAQEAERAEIVLFLVPPELDAADRRALVDALGAQFSLGETRLLLEEGEATSSALGARIAATEARAEETAALAVCWLDVEPDGRWLLHVLDPAHDRLVVRPVDAAENRRASAIEAVAVMARDSAEAIASGLALPAPALAPTKAPTPTVVPVPASLAASAPGSERTAHRPIRLSVGYAGHDFAPETSWRHGALVTASWMTELGPFVGASWMPTQDATVEAPIRFAVERPAVLALSGGHRWTLAPFALDGLVGLTFDVLARHTPPQLGALRASDRSRLSVALSPRAQAEWAATTALGLYASAGIDVLLNNFQYLYDDDGTQAVLQPHRLRLVVSGGIAVYP